MVGKSKPATAQQQQRMERIKLYTGCLPTLILGYPNRHCEVHHIVDGGRRKGHDFTYGVSPWFHRGHGEGKSNASMTNQCGPSMAVNPREYRLAFGSEDILLATQDFALELYDERPWDIMRMPVGIAFEIRKRHFDAYPASHYAALKWGISM